jgi:hypothetical protein
MWAVTSWERSGALWGTARNAVSGCRRGGRDEREQERPAPRGTLEPARERRRRAQVRDTGPARGILLAGVLGALVWVALVLGGMVLVLHFVG